MRQRLSRLAMLVTTAFLVGGAGPGTANSAAPLRFSQAAVLLELNDTDGDPGIHAAIYGESWTDLEIEGPGDSELLNIHGRGRMRAQGLTQLSFESAEPSFDELDPADFFRRFPEGRYEIEGRTQEGGTIAGTAVLSRARGAPGERPDQQHGGRKLLPAALDRRTAGCGPDAARPGSDRGFQAHQNDVQVPGR
jgi:hypothetical protein